MDSRQALEDAKALKRQLESMPPEKAVGLTSTYDLLCQSARKYGPQTALRFLETAEPGGTSRTWSYSELLSQLHRCANVLTSLGVGPDDAVGLMLPGCLEYYSALWGAEAAGIAAPLNPMLKAEKLISLLRAAQAKVLITYGGQGDCGYWDKACAIQKALPDLKILTVAPLGEPDLGAELATSFTRACAAAPDDKLISGRQISGDDIAAYIHTGGTSGTPKLAKHTHFGQVCVTWAHASLSKIPESGCMIAGFPMYHVAGILPNGLSLLFRGVEVIIPTPLLMRNKGMVRNLWKLVERHKITGFTLAPTSFAALSNVPVGDADISSLRTIRTGSAAIPAELATRFRTQFGHSILEAYGMTEMTGLSAFVPAGVLAPPGCCGLPLPFARIRIGDMGSRQGNSFRDAPQGETGMILYSGPCTFAGYVDDSMNSEAFTPEGELISGDLGFFDENGLLNITGRAKDLIIRGGHNIEPKMIEDAMCRHPDVEHAAAVGAPDAYAGELPVVFVTLQEGATATEAELLEFARAVVDEGPARPKSVTVLEAMPMTNVGKIFKPEIREKAAANVVRTILATAMDPNDVPSVTAQIDPRGRMQVQLQGTPVPADLMEELRKLPVVLNQD